MNRKMLWTVALAALTLALVLSGCGKPQEQAPPTGPQAGAPSAPAEATTNIRQVGSNTMLPLAERWRSEYNLEHPTVAIAVDGSGSGTGIKALLDKSAEIANSSRDMKDKEKEQAKAAGVNPVKHVVGHDGIAVIVHKDNPLTEISLEQLSDLYSGKLTKWDEIGAKGLGTVQLINRESSSGTYEAFKEMAVQLHGKDKSREFAANTLNQTSTQAIVTMVGQTKTAIGYIGLGYVDDTVKVLKVIPAGGKDAVSATPENVLSGKYPISRALFIFTSGEPTGELKTYLDWIKGGKGQAIVSELGFVPVKAPAAPTS